MPRGPVLQSVLATGLQGNTTSLSPILIDGGASFDPSPQTASPTGPQRPPILLPNGDFSNPSTPPTLGSGVTISGGVANCSSAGQIASWAGVLTVGKSYRVTLDYNATSGANLRVNNSLTNAAAIQDIRALTVDSTNRSLTFLIFNASSTDLSIEADNGFFSGWVDNIVATEIAADTAVLPNGDFTRVKPSNQSYGAGVTQGVGVLTAAGAADVLHWTSVLTIGQQYSVALTYTCTAGSKLRLCNNATDGTNVVDIQSLTVDGASHTLTFATFTATNVDLTIGADTANFTGTLTSVVAALVSSSVNGSTTLAFTPTATLLGQGAITGSAALVLAPAGMVSGLIGGSSTLLVSPSGTLLGKGAVTGSSAVLVTPSATLLGNGAVAGSSSLTVSPSGTVLGRGAIVGASSLAVSPSGSLGGAASLLGSTAITSSLSGALTGQGAIQGVSALSVTGSGTALGQGSIAGSLSLTISGVLVAGTASPELWTEIPSSEAAWTNDNAVNSTWTSASNSGGLWTEQSSTGTWVNAPSNRTNWT